MVEKARQEKNSMLERWLAPLDSAPLECDGFSRVASTLLHRESISHQVIIGSLNIEGSGEIPLHFWIRFNDGSICDFRARMWLGNSETVPHGIFQPTSAQHYLASQVVDAAPLSTTMFQILAGCEQRSFAALSAAG